MTSTFASRFDLGHCRDILVTTPRDGVVLVELNRPATLNAITATMIDELTRVAEAADLATDVRAVIVTGAGRGFCSGLDLNDPGMPPGAEGTRSTTEAFIRQDHIATLNERIHHARTPWIAAINGPCVGGGLALALACDIRIASTAARLAAVFTTIGLSNCDMGVSYLLPRLVGASRSAELLLTARTVDAAEADRIGLVSGVSEPDALVGRALAVAEQIAAHPPFGVWMTKQTMWQALDAPSLRHAIDLENRTQIMLMATGDMPIATRAFAERTRPEWNPL